MRILAVSDLHNKIFNIDEIIKSVDLFVIAGDLTNYGMVEEYLKIFEWLKNIKITHNKDIIVVLGNHDNKKYLLRAYSNYKKYFKILDNEIIEYKGKKIYGTPYTYYCGWFNHYRTKDKCIELTIPKQEVDIIISHEPPAIYELCLGYKANYEMYLYMSKYTNKTFIYGHFHENSGNYNIINGNHYHNVSLYPKIIEI